MQITINVIIAYNSVLDYTYPLEAYADVNKAAFNWQKLTESAELDMTYTISQVNLEL